MSARAGAFLAVLMVAVGFIASLFFVIPETAIIALVVGAVFLGVAIFLWSPARSLLWLPLTLILFAVGAYLGMGW